jgi:hypothetical protein
MLKHSIEKMEYRNTKKGGRPPKEEKRSEQLCVMCTKAERNAIESKAKLALCSNSEFLRNLALDANVQIKHIPPEILKITGSMNHIAANLNQIARKRNMKEELSAIERATLNYLCTEIQNVVDNLKITFS